MLCGGSQTLFGKEYQHPAVDGLDKGPLGVEAFRDEKNLPVLGEALLKAAGLCR